MEPLYQGEPILAVAAVDELTAAEAIEKIQIDLSRCRLSSIRSTLYDRVVLIHERMATSGPGPLQPLHKVRVRLQSRNSSGPRPISRS
jgi:hypothetical protein